MLPSAVLPRPLTNLLPLVQYSAESSCYALVHSVSSTAPPIPPIVSPRPLTNLLATRWFIWSVPPCLAMPHHVSPAVFLTAPLVHFRVFSLRVGPFVQSHRAPQYPPLCCPGHPLVFLLHVGPFGQFHHASQCPVVFPQPLTSILDSSPCPILCRVFLLCIGPFGQSHHAPQYPLPCFPSHPPVFSLHVDPFGQSHRASQYPLPCCSGHSLDCLTAPFTQSFAESSRCTSVPPCSDPYVTSTHCMTFPPCPDSYMNDFGRRNFPTPPELVLCQENPSPRRVLTLEPLITTSQVSPNTMLPCFKRGI